MNKKKAFMKYENFIIIVMFFVFGIVFLDRMAVVFLFPFIAPELGLNNTQLGVIASVLALSWALSNVVFATLSDILGKKKVILIAFILIFSVSTFLSGVIGGYLSLLLVRILMGISEGPVIPLVNSVVMAESSPKRRGFNLGFVQSSSPLFGGALVPIVVVALATAFNWRFAFFFLAIPGIILALILMKYMKEPKFTDDGENGEVEKQKRISLSDYKIIVKNRNVVLNILVSTSFMVFFSTITAFTSLFLINIGGYSQTQAAAYMGVLGLGWFVWNLIGPAISDKVGRKPAIISYTLVSILIPLSIIFLHQNFILLLIVTVFLTAGMAYQPLSLAIIPAESVPKPLVASAIGLIVCIGEGLGATTGPLISGIFADKYSLYAPLIVVTIAAVLSFIFSLGIKETAPVKIGQNVVDKLGSEESAIVK